MSNPSDIKPATAVLDIKEDITPYESAWLAAWLVAAAPYLPDAAPVPAVISRHFIMPEGSVNSLDITFPKA